MAGLGYACLLIAIALCAYGVVAALHGARLMRPAPARGGAPGRAPSGLAAGDAWVASARRAVYALALALTIAMAVLEVAFLRNDFSFVTVAETSSRTTPEAYRAAAIWASQAGSLLLWSWLMSLWSSLVLFLCRRRLREATPYAIAVLLGLSAFFVSLMLFYASPFTTLRPVPAEGSGLDPLLRFSTMIIHPPMLYSGYTLAMIPFAFGVGALITRRLDAEWLRATRRFALASWLFLGFGILLGARWSFAELGWGGYWAWDPVENAALMPWLTGTAFLHSIMIQERRGMLKVWNAALVLGTGTLAIMGTFLVRSGVLDSIHAFGASTLGVPFVVLIAAMIAGSVYLVVSRRHTLRSEHRLDSLLCRESAFLGNNVVLVGLCFVVFWGTYFPLISKELAGQQASVGPPWFDRYTVPLALVLVLLSGIGPVIPWRRATTAALRRHLLWPLALALAVLAVLVAAGVTGSASALALFVCAAFALAVLGGEVARGTRARMAMAGELPPVALAGLVRRNRRRYGGYAVHAGVAVLLIGVAGSSSFAHQTQIGLSPGGTTRVGGYTVRYVRPIATVLGGADHTGATLDLGAVLAVSRDGRHVATLRPLAGYYESSEAGQGAVGALIGGQAVSHISMDTGLAGDVWSSVEPNIAAPQLQRVVEAGNRVVPPGHPEEALVALAVLARSYLRNPPPSQFNLITFPLVEWIWLGGLLALLGSLIAIWPGPLALRQRIRLALPRRALEEPAGELVGA
jgi:cytochrome c-type biogenesis protein CcmF